MVMIKLTSAIVLCANLAISTSAMAATVNVNCNLADISRKGNPNVANEALSLQVGEKPVVIYYSGVNYEISLGTVSAPGAFELIVAYRDSATNNLLGSAIATFSNDNPDVILQNGANILLRCAGH